MGKLPEMTYRPDLDIRSQLRFASQSERDELVRFKLRGCADELDAAILAFRQVPSGSSLAALVGLWAAGKRVLNQAGGQAHLSRDPPK
jgi:hypothetical protein